MRFSILGKTRDSIRGFVWTILDFCSAKQAITSPSIVVFPQIGLGDQILLLGGFLHLSYSKRIHVLITPNFLPFTKILPANSNLTFEVIPEKYLRAPGWNSRRQFVRTIAKQRSSRYIFIGSEIVGWMTRFRPDLCTTQNCYRLLNVDFQKYQLIDFFQAVTKSEIEQIEIPSRPYAVIDTYVGEPREIPEFFLTDIAARGIELIHNPRKIELLKLANMLVNADEIHVTNSALFCLCLVLPLKAKTKRIYLMNSTIFNGHGFYDGSWQEIPILENRDRNINGFTVIDRVSLLEKNARLSRQFPRNFVELLFKQFKIGQNLLTSSCANSD
jgi:hypothetical protein